MDSIRNRAIDNFPSVLLTLLSIIQAIALESLWDHAVHRQELYAFSWDALLGWLQVSICLNTILIIWLIYVGFIMRFRIVPTAVDLLLPFLVGLIEFSMIELLQPGMLWAYVLILSLIVVLVGFLIYRLLRRARRHPENREFFDAVPPATWRDFLPQGVGVIFCAMAATWIWYSGDRGWFVLTVLVVALIASIYIAYIEIKFWRVSMRASPGVENGS